MITPNLRACLALTLALGLSVVVGCSSQPKIGELQKGQSTFATPEDATAALVAALRGNEATALKNILGPQADEVLDSGDPIVDRETRQRAVTAYDERHSLVANEDGTRTLVLGNQDWPMPIPLRLDAKSNRWFFDTAAGEDEIISRRIGRNELTVIEVSRAIVDAQVEYAHLDPDGDGVTSYAMYAISSAGKRDGLYWPTEPGELPSPLGSLVASAEAEGYTARPVRGADYRPYHGYYFRILTAQGPAAFGGESDYIVNGRLIGGFAIVAWPADYGNSGVMTFMTNFRGDVFQQDLGKNTDRIARGMKKFNPDSNWTRVQ
jgi:hypothetical protein